MKEHSLGHSETQVRYHGDDLQLDYFYSSPVSGGDDYHDVCVASDEQNDQKLNDPEFCMISPVPRDFPESEESR